MSEDTRDDSARVAEGSDAPPMPSGSSAGSGEGSSAVPGQDLSTVLKRIDDLANSIPDMIDARFKSGQDRNVYRIERDLEELKAIVTKSGGDFNKVETDLKISELTRQLERLSGGGGRQVAPGRADLTAEWVAAQASTEIILDDAGIEHHDPEYVAFQQRYAGRVTPDDWPSIVQKWADKTKKQRQSQPGASFSESSTPPGDMTPDELKAQYDKELAQIPRGRVQDIHKVQLKYRKMGLNV